LIDLAHTVTTMALHGLEILLQWRTLMIGLFDPRANAQAGSWFTPRVTGQLPSL